MSRRLTWTVCRVPFKRPFRTAYGDVTHRTLVVARLQDDGVTGLAELLVADDPASIETTQRDLAHVAAAVDGGNPLDEILTRYPALASLDVAELDLESRRAGMGLALMLGCGAESVPVNATIGTRSIADVERSTRTALAAGFRTVKVKVGGGVLQDDIARVGAVRALSQDVAIRLDANGGWSREEAARAISHLAPFDPQYIEQPTADWENLVSLSAESEVPLAADETVWDGMPLDNAVAVVIVKPLRLGGFARTLGLARRCLSAGKAVTVTTSLDSGIGTAVALHVAACLPPPVPASGLATLDLLEDDLVLNPPLIEKGRMLLPTGPGLGVEVDEDAVERYRLRESA